MTKEMPRQPRKRKHTWHKRKRKRHKHKRKRQRRALCLLKDKHWINSGRRRHPKRKRLHNIMRQLLPKPKQMRQPRV